METVQRGIDNHGREHPPRFLRGTDGTGKDLTLEQAIDRQTRLNKTIRILYHQTDPDSAVKILQQGRLLRGDAALPGGGIYFATKPDKTFAEAQAQGWMLKCRVRAHNSCASP